MTRHLQTGSSPGKQRLRTSTGCSSIHWVGLALVNRSRTSRCGTSPHTSLPPPVFRQADFIRLTVPRSRAPNASCTPAPITAKIQITANPRKSNGNYNTILANRSRQGLPHIPRVAEDSSASRTHTFHGNYALLHGRKSVRIGVRCAGCELNPGKGENFHPQFIPNFVQVAAAESTEI